MRSPLRAGKYSQLEKENFLNGTAKSQFLVSKEAVEWQVEGLEMILSPILLPLNLSTAILLLFTTKATQTNTPFSAGRGNGKELFWIPTTIPIKNTKDLATMLFVLT